jgi:pyruvate formate lyase activating enzyme
LPRASSARRIRQELGAETPWHCSGYYPAHKFTAPPLLLQTLERAHDIGREEGLDLVYLGNVLGHRYNTYCPECGELLIGRRGLSVTRHRLKDSKCPRCGRTVPVVMGAAGHLR